MINLLWLACEFDLYQSQRKSSQVHSRPCQTESQVDPNFQPAAICDSVWPGLKLLEPCTSGTDTDNCEILRYRICSF